MSRKTLVRVSLSLLLAMALLANTGCHSLTLAWDLCGPCYQTYRPCGPTVYVRPHHRSRCR